MYSHTFPRCKDNKENEKTNITNALPQNKAKAPKNEQNAPPPESPPLFPDTPLLTILGRDFTPSARGKLCAVGVDIYRNLLTITAKISNTSTVMIAIVINRFVAILFPKVSPHGLSFRCSPSLRAVIGRI